LSTKNDGKYVPKLVENQSRMFGKGHPKPNRIGSRFSIKKRNISIAGIAATLRLTNNDRTI
jgi:hypothetical protein